MSGMRWHYGPTATDPNPGSMWHYDCGGEVWGFEDGYICRKCGMQEDENGQVWTREQIEAQIPREQKAFDDQDLLRKAQWWDDHKDDMVLQEAQQEPPTPEQVRQRLAEDFDNMAMQEMYLLIHPQGEGAEQCQSSR